MEEIENRRPDFIVMDTYTDFSTKPATPLGVPCGTGTKWFHPDSIVIEVDTDVPKGESIVIYPYEYAKWLASHESVAKHLFDHYFVD